MDLALGVLSLGRFAYWVACILALWLFFTELCVSLSVMKLMIVEHLRTRFFVFLGTRDFLSVLLALIPRRCTEALVALEACRYGDIWCAINKYKQKQRKSENWMHWSATSLKINLSTTPKRAYDQENINVRCLLFSLNPQTGSIVTKRQLALSRLRWAHFRRFFEFEALLYISSTLAFEQQQMFHNFSLMLNALFCLWNVKLFC